jgi:hypothetical protein
MILEDPFFVLKNRKIILSVTRIAGDYKLYSPAILVTLKFFFDFLFRFGIFSSLHSSNEEPYFLSIL